MTIFKKLKLAKSFKRIVHPVKRNESLERAMWEFLLPAVKRHVDKGMLDHPRFMMECIDANYSPLDFGIFVSVLFHSGVATRLTVPSD
jgi:hypothetical protein